MSSTLSRSKVNGDGSWCASCGSPVPAGLDMCPVCGMPLEGAFDNLGEPYVVSGTPSVAGVQGGDDAESTGFVSAIPPVPKGEDAEMAPLERVRHMRLVVLAAVAALMVVGGTALYITRPWNPDAYSIHATEDADTSMEGFPGERSHLSAQDRVQEAQRQKALDEAESYTNDVYARLGELADNLSASKASMLAYLADDSQVDDQSGSDESAALASELDEAERVLDSYDFDDQGLMGRRDEVLVLVRYLEGAAEVLQRSWDVALGQNGEQRASSDALTVLGGGIDGRGFDDWMELFRNAYAGS